MSDLQCPARIFVARHGEAAYESPLLSDAGGWLTALGRRQSRQLADSLAGERLARVFTSDLARAVQTGEVVAGQLGTDVVVREGLREFSVGEHAGADMDPDPFAPTFTSWLAGDLDARIAGGESGAEVVARVEAALSEVADSHRGEAVLVVSHGGAICLAVPVLARNLDAAHARELPLPNCGLVALEADADGWVVRSWDGRPVDAR
jgi:2,3-bisphosphoglycerate-dependent phosphoglycerate mutase